MFRRSIAVLAILAVAAIATPPPAAAAPVRNLFTLHAVATAPVVDLALTIAPAFTLDRVAIDRSLALRAAPAIEPSGGIVSGPAVVESLAIEGHALAITRSDPNRTRHLMSKSVSQRRSTRTTATTGLGSRHC
jgi:hypothetical protein